MNITEYYSETDGAAVYRGKMSLKQNYTIVNADESIYRYVGVNSARPVTVLVHPDDLPSFKEAMDKLSDGTQRLILRFLGSDGNYRYMYAIMKYNGRMVEDFRSIDIELMDIMRIYCEYDQSYNAVLKYKKFMSASDKMYFEYSYGDENITIFEYMDGRSVGRFKENIHTVMKKVSEGDTYTFKQKAEFGVLYECLTNFSDSIELEVDGVVFGMSGVRLKIKGGVLYRDDDRNMMAAVITKYNIDDDKEEKYYMTSYALDSSKGFYNKRAISELSRDMIAEANGKDIYVIILDIDDFKSFNDNFGHMMGDKVIAKISEVIRNVVGNRGYAGRIGGDEFFIITDRVQNEDELIYMLKTIRKNIDWQFDKIIKSVEVNLSIGIAKYPNDATGYDELFKIADKCLYIAKAKGKNRFIIYNPQLYASVVRSEDDKYNTVAKLSDNKYQICQLVYEVISDIRKNGEESVRGNLDKIRQAFDIDGISVYAGRTYEKKCSSGVYFIEEGDTDFVTRAEEDNIFDANGLFAINKIISIKEQSPKAYEKLEKTGITGFIMVKFEGENGEKAMITFDIMKRLRKWSEEEKGLLLIVAKTVAEQYIYLHS